MVDEGENGFSEMVCGKLSEGPLEEPETILIDTSSEHEVLIFTIQSGGLYRF